MCVNPVLQISRGCLKFTDWAIEVMIWDRKLLTAIWLFTLGAKKKKKISHHHRLFYLFMVCHVKCGIICIHLIVRRQKRQSFKKKKVVGSMFRSCEQIIHKLFSAAVQENLQSCIRNIFSILQLFRNTFSNTSTPSQKHILGFTTVDFISPSSAPQH